MMCLSLMQEPTMSTYISELQMSVNAAEEDDLDKRRFSKIDVNLNKESGGKAVYLWYKHGSEAITKVQICLI